MESTVAVTSERVRLDNYFAAPFGPRGSMVSGSKRFLTRSLLESRIVGRNALSGERLA